jgi:hypothetical protein
MPTEADIIKFFEIIPDATAPCAGCSKQATKDGFVIQENQVFHSEGCASIKLARLVKSQPKGIQVTAPNGEIWDV